MSDHNFIFISNFSRTCYSFILFSGSFLLHKMSRPKAIVRHGKRDTIVALLGWAGAVDRNVEKYAGIYQKKGYVEVRKCENVCQILLCSQLRNLGFIKLHPFVIFRYTTVQFTALAAVKGWGTKVSRRKI